MKKKSSCQSLKRKSIRGMKWMMIGVDLAIKPAATAGINQ